MLQRARHLGVDLGPEARADSSSRSASVERGPLLTGLLRLPQHQQHPLQVLQRRPAGLLDGAQGPVGELRVARRPRRARLHHRDGQRVADGVVQLAGDAGAFQELLGALLQGGEPLGRRTARADRRRSP